MGKPCVSVLLMDRPTDGMKSDQILAWHFVTIGLAKINRRRASMPADDLFCKAICLSVAARA